MTSGNVGNIESVCEKPNKQKEGYYEGYHKGFDKGFDICKRQELQRDKIKDAFTHFLKLRRCLSSFDGLRRAECSSGGWYPTELEEAVLCLRSKIIEAEPKMNEVVELFEKFSTGKKGG